MFVSYNALLRSSLVHFPLLFLLGAHKVPNAADFKTRSSSFSPMLYGFLPVLISTTLYRCILRRPFLTWRSFVTSFWDFASALLLPPPLLSACCQHMQSLRRRKLFVPGRKAFRQKQPKLLLCQYGKRCHCATTGAHTMGAFWAPSLQCKVKRARWQL